jgi:hypothetical protein
MGENFVSEKFCEERHSHTNETHTEIKMSIGEINETLKWLVRGIIATLLVVTGTLIGVVWNNLSTDKEIKIIKSVEAAELKK